MKEVDEEQKKKKTRIHVFTLEFTHTHAHKHANPDDYKSSLFLPPRQLQRQFWLVVKKHKPVVIDPQRVSCLLTDLLGWCPLIEIFRKTLTATIRQLQSMTATVAGLILQQVIVQVDIL